MAPTPPQKQFSVLAAALLVLCAGWLAWNHHARLTRLRQISDIPTWSVDMPIVDATSPTGYADGRRRLILPESDYAGEQLIVRAQGMLAGDGWVQRHISYENAPHGRETHQASLGGWWLAVLARMDVALTGSPAGIAVERAALYANPLLLILLLAGVGLILRKTHGGIPAIAAVLSLTLAFPLADNFLAGSLGHSTGLLVVNALSLLLLAAALGKNDVSSAYFAGAGAAGGLGLWLNAPWQGVLLGGLLLGGIGLRRLGGQSAGSERNWRIFGVSGALVSLAGYLIEYGWTDFSWRLEANHPLYALAWLGGAEVLARFSSKAPTGADRRFALFGWIGAIAALAVLLAAYVWGESLPPWQLDPQMIRLSGLFPISAENLWQWLRRDGLSLPLVATLWPALLFFTATGLAWRRDRQAPTGLPAGWLLAGPVVLLLALACWRLSWWSLWQAAALALLPILWPSSGQRSIRPILWIALAAGPGLLCLWQSPPKSGKPVLTESEWIGLIERDLAYWLTKHGPADGTRVLAPPALTGSLHYYGSITGLGTFAWENQDGLTAAARMASAGSPDEAQQLMEGRGVTHIVMPGWDDFLDQYAGLGRAGATGSGAANNTFVAALHRWEQPAWLWPRAYPIPKTVGASEREVTVFAVGETQGAPSALGRLAEYFVESGRLELSARAKQALRSHPGHLGALVATAMVDAAHRDSAAFQDTITRLQPLLAAGGDRTLPWDRRVSLAVVLATAKQSEAARTQLQRCLREATESKLRALPVQSLRQLLMLQERMSLSFPTPELARIARELLPPAARTP